MLDVLPNVIISGESLWTTHSDGWNKYVYSADTISRLKKLARLITSPDILIIVEGVVYQRLRFLHNLGNSNLGRLRFAFREKS